MDVYQVFQIYFYSLPNKQTKKPLPAAFYIYHNTIHQIVQVKSHEIILNSSLLYWALHIMNLITFHLFYYSTLIQATVIFCLEYFESLLARFCFHCSQFAIQHTK